MNKHQTHGKAIIGMALKAIITKYNNYIEKTVDYKLKHKLGYQNSGNKITELYLSNKTKLFDVIYSYFYIFVFTVATYFMSVVFCTMLYVVFQFDIPTI